MSEAEIAGYVQNLLGASSAGPNVILSHGDRDHYRYIAGVLATTQADNIWQGGEPADYNSDGFPAWLQAQQQGGATVRNNLPADWHNDAEPLGEALSCGLAHTYVLTVNTHTTKNSQSLVLMLEYGGFAAVFTGDAEGTTESRAINNFGNNLKASVMSASHHGAITHRSNGAIG